MRKRYEYLASRLPPWHFRPGVALRRSLAGGYTRRDLAADVLAGLVVGVVALPLNMALAIASGVRPENGLYTAIVAGALAALLGGSKVQVTGPTAAFVVILAPVAGQFGLAGLALATVLAGVLLMAMGLLRMGRLVEFIPYPVTTGFTAGIAVVIATLQVRDFLGLAVVMPDHYIDKVGAIIGAARAKFIDAPLSAATYSDVAIGVGTLAVLLLWPRLSRRVPAPLVALPLAAVAAYVGHRVWPEFKPATIMQRFGGPAAPSGIPAAPPMPVAPWFEPGPGGGPLTLDMAVVRALLGAGFAIAMLGAIESLLSAVVADGMTGKKHDPDAELFAQGVANVAAPFFGGFAATGAIARTATNIRSGGRSPIAAVVHAVFLLGAVLVLAPLLGHLPMAAMAALLLVVARNMAEVKHVAFLCRFAPRGDVAVLAACFLLTVVFDMVVAVSAGVVMAALLFMRRMAETSTVRLVGPEHPVHSQPVPEGVMIYDIGGPLFFGAAAKAMSTLSTTADGLRVVILDLTDVPTIDATGLANLDALITRHEKRNVFTVLTGVQTQPAAALTRAGWMSGRSRVAVCGEVGAGVEIARAWIEEHP